MGDEDGQKGVYKVKRLERHMTLGSIHTPLLTILYNSNVSTTLGMILKLRSNITRSHSRDVNYCCFVKPTHISEISAKCPLMTVPLSTKCGYKEQKE